MEVIEIHINERVNKVEHIQANLQLIANKCNRLLAVNTLTESNFRIKVTEGCDERELAFKVEVSNYENKYDVKMLKGFFEYWSEWDRNRKEMRWEKQKTWETGKRLATWNKKRY
jgi:hypothetical protein